MLASTDECLRFADGYCLHDSAEKGEAFLKELQQCIEQSPKPLSASEIPHIKQWVYKMLERSKSLEVEPFHRLYWLAVDLLQIYLNLPDNGILARRRAWLRKHDAVGYQLFSQVYNPSMRFDDLGKLSEYVTNIHCCSQQVRLKVLATAGQLLLESAFEPLKIIDAFSVSESCKLKRS